MKKMQLPIQSMKEFKDRCIQEIELMAQLNHKNVVHLVGYMLTEEEVILFTPLYDCNLSLILAKRLKKIARGEVEPRKFLIIVRLFNGFLRQNWCSFVIKLFKVWRIYIVNQ